MQYSKPCQMLVDEHEVILSVIEAVETVAQSPDDSAFADEFYEKACDFFATFADKCHHGKEEVHLFPMLESRGIPREGGPIACMLHDHDEGRAHIRAVREALRCVKEGDLVARAIVKADALQFCELLRQHIQKENQVLFVVGDQAMSAADKELLFKKFNCAEGDTLPAGSHEKYLSIARELREAAGLGAATPRSSCGHAVGTHVCHTRQGGTFA